MGVASSAGWVGNVKCGYKRTCSGIKVPAQNRQQLRLDRLQRVLQLSSRVSFGDVPFGQRRGRRQVNVRDVHALAVRQADLRKQAVFVARGYLDVQRVTHIGG